MSHAARRARWHAVGTTTRELDDEAIRAILFDLVIAGSDTTASTLSAALYLLHEVTTMTRTETTEPERTEIKRRKRPRGAVTHRSDRGLLPNDLALKIGRVKDPSFHSRYRRVAAASV